MKSSRNVNERFVRLLSSYIFFEIRWTVCVSHKVYWITIVCPKTFEICEILEIFKFAGPAFLWTEPMRKPDRTYSVAQKSESVTFFSNFWLFLYLDLIFSPNKTCAKMQHALHYQLVLRMSIFFFPYCINSTRHIVYRLSDQFCFYIFPAIMNHIS